VNEDARRLLIEFFGGRLAVVGAMIAILSGLCTAVGLAFDPGMAIAVGTLPILLGGGLWLGGMAIVKGARPPPRPVLPPANFTGPTDGEAS
jgi:ribulose 1,5-bisphosphate synthetase/thiazole synthase